MANRVAVVLAGDHVALSWLTPWLAEADVIVAADGGADLVLACGYQTDVLIGDLDSVSEQAIKNSKLVIHLQDQETSDCDKVLRYVSDQGKGDFVVMGAEGGRIDHMLGILHSIAKGSGHCLVAYRHMLARVLLGPAALQFFVEGTVSALPLAHCRGVSMSNVDWPLNQVEMAATGLSSLSNQGKGEVSVSLDSGALAVFWEYSGQPIWPQG